MTNNIRSTVACALMYLLSVLFLAPHGAGREPVKEKKIELMKVRTKALVDTHIAANKGKVVAIYVWACWNVPSWKEFENVAKLHQTYADQGLVYMTADLGYNEAEKKLQEEAMKRSLRLLQARKAHFANYYLEDSEAAENLWNIGLAPPIVIVYGRDGKLARVFRHDSDFSYKNVEEFVKKKLMEK